MNKKEEELNRLVDVVIDCCDMEGKNLVTREKLLGGCKEENVVMTRCILVFMLLRYGYTITTCANLMGCSQQTARVLMTKDGIYQETSRAYRLAKAEATLRCSELIQD